MTGLSEEGFHITSRVLIRIWKELGSKRLEMSQGARRNLDEASGRLVAKA